MLPLHQTHGHKGLCFMISLAVGYMLYPFQYVSRYMIFMLVSCSISRCFFTSLILVSSRPMPHCSVFHFCGSKSHITRLVCVILYIIYGFYHFFILVLDLTAHGHSHLDLVLSIIFRRCHNQYPYIALLLDPNCHGSRFYTEHGHINIRVRHKDNPYLILFFIQHPLVNPNGRNSQGHLDFLRFMT